MHRLQPLFKVRDDVLGDLPHARLRTDHGLQLRPLSLQPLPPLDLLALGGVFEVRVDARTLVFVQDELRQAALRSR